MKYNLYFPFSNIKLSDLKLDYNRKELVYISNYGKEPILSAFQGHRSFSG